MSNNIIVLSVQLNFNQRKSDSVFGYVLSFPLICSTAEVEYPQYSLNSLESFLARIYIVFLLDHVYCIFVDLKSFGKKCKLVAKYVNA